VSDLAAPEGPRRRASRVLVVDDSPFMRSRIVRDLAAGGIEVVGQARNGREAAELYARIWPDAVTMDLTMREHDGLSGTRAIRALDPAARVVLFSIVDDRAALAEAMAAGVVACIHKGRPAELVQCLLDLGPRGK
jgi:two-component system, chemotaxis family, chemotaxis protein CheY